MPVDVGALLDDLAGETQDLVAVLDRLSEAEWQRPTPAVGWTVQMQVTHLAFFDEAATLSAVDPERFVEQRGPGLAADDLPDQVATRHQAMSGTDALRWFRSARQAYLGAMAGVGPELSLPWYGPPMSVASSVTARLMETWAHGHDVTDALGLSRRSTARLRHVAHLGVRTLAWSFSAHDLPKPTVPVRVELTGPDGDVWTWGPSDAVDRVEGEAEDFCLVVTQRRDREQTTLQVHGPVARTWLDHAQAFAGRPGRRR